MNGGREYGAYKIIRQSCVCVCIHIYKGTITIMEAYAVVYTCVCEVMFTGIIHLRRLLFPSFARFHAIRVIKCYIGLNIG